MAAACGGGTGPSGPSRSDLPGTLLNRPVPRIPLVDARGNKTSLAALRGKYVVLAPSLTLCSEVCPITTAAFGEIKKVLKRDGVARRVALVEVTVDPWRDTPSRLRAYARRAHVTWTLLTGSRRHVRRFWNFFQLFYRRTPPARPAPTDWFTHKPEKFDVAHQDGVFIIDPRGRWRYVLVGMPQLSGRISPWLKARLDRQGLRHLARPASPWTVPQVISGLGYLMGRRLDPDPGPGRHR